MGQRDYFCEKKSLRLLSALGGSAVIFNLRGLLTLSIAHLSNAPLKRISQISKCSFKIFMARNFWHYLLLSIIVFDID